MLCYQSRYIIANIKREVKDGQMRSKDEMK